jgi:beta-phosphoglucomutase-like phosphatase (HAD superfamily)
MQFAIGTEPSPVDAAALHWRAALDAADDALRAASRSLPAQELALRRARLAAERSLALADLQAFARDEGASGRFLHVTPRRDEKRLLGLPAGIAACIFNLDGVLVGSAALHAAAWQQTLDEFTGARRGPTGSAIVPFDPRTDYLRYLHGRPRVEGVHAFLASRGIRLPDGDARDPAGAETVNGLANRKNDLLRRRIDELGVAAYAGSWQYLETALEAGVHTAVVSASANTDRILERAGLIGVVEGCVDGNAIVSGHLRGRPAPDRLLAACRRVGVEPSAAAAFETSVDGIRAAASGQFAFVVGIDQTGHADDLRAGGADLVVPSLAELLERHLAVRT